jgi:hypothetical protein
MGSPLNCVISIGETDQGTEHLAEAVRLLTMLIDAFAQPHVHALSVGAVDRGRAPRPGSELTTCGTWELRSTTL